MTIEELIKAEVKNMTLEELIKTIEIMLKFDKILYEEKLKDMRNESEKVQ